MTTKVNQADWNKPFSMTTKVNQADKPGKDLQAKEPSNSVLK
jgi:hypothetical protein